MSKKNNEPGCIHRIIAMIIYCAFYSVVLLGFFIGALTIAVYLGLI